VARTEAFTRYIDVIGSNDSEDNSVSQTSPAWILTFVRWNIRDTLRAIRSGGGGVSSELLAVRDPLVVENDCVQVSTSSNKASMTPSMTAVLRETDVNYETSVAPGDFVFVNMFNWESDARALAYKASNKKDPINLENDGFKGIYKIQSVRKTITTDPQTGTKVVLIRIDGYAFTEFNNKIYYNPYLRTDYTGSDKDNLLFASNIQLDYKNLVTPTSHSYGQDIIKFLIQAFIGVGISDRGVTFAAGSPVTANTHFYVPQQVGTFLGNGSAKSAKDIYNYLFGLQFHSTSQEATLGVGMNPSNIKSTKNRFAYTNIPCGGQCILKPDYWNQQNAWSILQQYLNAPLNEMYTCFKIDPTGHVMPTVVMRQIPFTTDFFGKSAPFNTKYNVTNFSRLPRWKINPALIISSDIGRDEAARINFVQYYTQPPSGTGKPEGFMSAQTAAHNYVYDVNDVMRSGLRPYVITTSFEDITKNATEKIGRQWAEIVGDSLMGGHLKMNGTLECAGIVDPIAVGDNLEFDGTVFHIEEVTHSGSINSATGTKIFRTMLKLSNGVSVSTTDTGIAYSEMIHTRGYQDRKDDYDNMDQILPGVSEEQDIRARAKHGRVEPTADEIKQADSPYAQPGSIIKKNKRKKQNKKKKR
jgi:hypothetical protein